MSAQGRQCGDCPDRTRTRSRWPPHRTRRPRVPRGRRCPRRELVKAGGDHLGEGLPHVSSPGDVPKDVQPQLRPGKGRRRAGWTHAAETCDSLRRDGQLCARSRVPPESTGQTRNCTTQRVATVLRRRAGGVREVRVRRERRHPCAESGTRRRRRRCHPLLGRVVERSSSRSRRHAPTALAEDGDEGSHRVARALRVPRRSGRPRSRGERRREPSPDFPAPLSRPKRGPAFRQ